VATTPDGLMTSSIHQNLAEKDGLPSEHYVDAAYVDSYQLVESHQVHQVELVDPVAVDVSWQRSRGVPYCLSPPQDLFSRPYIHYGDIPG